MQPLPRQLWELRGSHAGTCELMLRMLHRTSIFAQAGRPISAALQRLQGQLMPCFLLVQPLQQSKKTKKGALDGRVKIVAGPLARLPTKCQVIFPRLKVSFPSVWIATAPCKTLISDACFNRQGLTLPWSWQMVAHQALTHVQSAFVCICEEHETFPAAYKRGIISRVRQVYMKLTGCRFALQELALDILYYVQEPHESTLRTLVLLCLSPAYPPSLAQRAVSIVQHTAQAGRIAPDLYLSFLASLVVGRSSTVGEDLLDSEYARAEQVVSSASRAVASFPGSAGAPLVFL